MNEQLTSQSYPESTEIKDYEDLVVYSVSGGTEWVTALTRDELIEIVRRVWDPTEDSEAMKALIRGYLHTACRRLEALHKDGGLGELV